MKLLAILLLIPGLAFAAAGGGPARMDYLAQVAAKENGFSGTVLVVRNGKTLLEKGYGVDAGAPRPIGGITMQITAAAILLLQEDGKLHLDDPLSAYLPGTPAAWNKVTLRTILAQESGIGGYEKFADPHAQLAKPPAELMQAVFETFPAPEPDKEFNLSSPAYILLGLVIEKASGMAYADFIEKRIFAPLGMKQSSLPAKTPESGLTGFLFSAGGIVSTAQDMAIWANALYGGKLLSPASLQAMISPSNPDGFYGLGTLISDEDGYKVYSHFSAMLDGNSGLVAYGPRDKTILVMLGKSNFDTMKELAGRLGKVARGEKVVLKSEQVSTAQPNVLIPTEKFAMPGLDRERGLRIYVPPDYADHPDRRYPVIYMHDGQNLFDVKTAYAEEWGVDETLNDLARKTGFEAVVVGIDNGLDKRMSELNPYPGPKLKEAEGPDYMRFIVEVVKPYIDRTYRTLPDRANTAIVGSSMGGLISHYALQSYPQIFSKYGVFSPSYWASPELTERAEKQTMPPDTRVYLYAGTKEGGDMEGRTRAMAATLARQGPPEDVTLHIRQDAIHYESFWRPEFRTAVIWLFQIKDKDSQALSH